MDVDSWASRVHSAKHFSAVQAARLNSDNHSMIGGSEGHDDVGAFFPCPFCYIEIEVSVLCSHLQEEHCFDLKNAVCPLCAANLGKDAIGHFMVQHSHSLKRRRKSQKSGFFASSPASIGKELRDLSIFLGSTSINDKGNTKECAPDILLSPFLCSTPLSDPTENLGDRNPGNASTILDVRSNKSSTPDEGHEQDYEERRQKTEFVGQLIFSTIF